MIDKSGSTCYLFDFDGTIAGKDDWTGLWENTRSCIENLHINPSKYDIRWSILTGRPGIDRIFLKLYCKLYGLTPIKIFTGKDFFYKKSSDIIMNDVYRYKLDIIIGILKGEIDMDRAPLKIAKVVYIDNDLKTLQYLNDRLYSNNFLSITVPDFINGNFHFLM